MGKLIFKTPKLDFKTPKLVFKTPKLLSPALSLQVLGWIPHKKFACVGRQAAYSKNRSQLQKMTTGGATVCDIYTCLFFKAYA